MVSKLGVKSGLVGIWEGRTGTVSASSLVVVSVSPVPGVGPGLVGPGMSCSGRGTPFLKGGPLLGLVRVGGGPEIPGGKRV